MVEAPLFNTASISFLVPLAAAGDLSPQTLLSDKADGFHFSFRNSGKPSLNKVYAKFI